MNTIIVEGLIGSGKSSLCTQLAEELGEGTLLLLEPDEQENANPYLSVFYGNIRRWCFTMQVHLLQRRFQMQLLAQQHVLNNRGNAVIDRSFQGDTCFARMHAEYGTLQLKEYQTYCELYHAMTAFVLAPNVCLRVMTTPGTALKRIHARAEKRDGRKCESKLDVDYLERLDDEIGLMMERLPSTVHIENVAWDADRDTPDQRLATVQGLAQRIKRLKLDDPLLRLHPRTT